jgi:uncharacterized protein (TIGR00288 family)
MLPTPPALPTESEPARGANPEASPAAHFPYSRTGAEPAARTPAPGAAASASPAPASSAGSAAIPLSTAPPAGASAPQPYRAFWQPRPPAPAAEEAPAAPHDAAAAASEPAAPAYHGSAAGLSEEEPIAAETRTDDHHGQGRGRQGSPGRQPLVPSAAPAREAAADDLESDGELDGDSEGESEAGETEAGEGDLRPEARKKRSRRSRGGRRKNGRAAAASGTAEPADDEEEDAPFEEPLPAPVQLLPPPPAARVPRSGESYVISAGDLDSMTREIIISVPDRQRPQHEERKIAVFCDFENIALGVRDSEISKLDIGLILERLLEKGKIIVKKAYADWERYSDYKRPFHEAAIELIDIPQKFYSGKNSADIKMVVDAMDLSYSKEHLDTFVILSGDSDFSPLVSKLKENNKYVIGIGVKNSSSNLLVDNCDEFIYYEDIWRDAQKGPKLDGLSKKTAEAVSLMVESIQALVRENKDVLWGSMIKQTMQRKKPSFNEGYYGYSTFSELLEDAERKNIIKLKKDQRSGTYIVTGFAKTGDAGPVAPTGPGRRQA